MKTAEKLAAGWLLSLGFMFLTLSASAAIQKNSMQKPFPPSPYGEPQEILNKEAIYVLDNTTLHGLVFGVPTSILGVWLAMGLFRQSQQDKKVLKQQASEEMQSTFYRMLQDNGGRVTLLSFAMQSQLPPATARKYLDEQAKIFNASFKVSEDGGISYHFDL
ncbi:MULTISPECIES: hypothetical protein [Nostocales]|uniref:Uncharacterized protein n=3 Tax=Nostocales TaxID=1161 RepID=A0A0C1RGW6_9CYAN|nr:hypothetical protein [Tolypothrix bouteillei]KAF3887389.1 hypothetical protein DA73_0400019255 [Tolypothrix bouteillei VB521301]